MAVKDVRKPPARTKRTRTETQREFDDLKEDIEATVEAADSKAIEAAKFRETQVRRDVEDIGIETVVGRISALGIDVSRALADISEKLTQEVRLLAAVREAVALERGEIERLHKIDIAASGLDQMMQDYAREKERLDAEISGQRAGWEEEGLKVLVERKEQDDAIKKQRQREIEEYDYKKNLERKKDKDKYEEEQRLTAKKNQERQEAMEKDWLSRDAALKEREDELVRLKKDAAEQPMRLEKEIAAAVDRARLGTTSKVDQQMLILKTGAETEKRIAELKVKALEEALARNGQQIAALEKQLTEAKQQVQDIAVKAIEGASGARALSHINQIAMEQAKNRPQG